MTDLAGLRILVTRPKPQGEELCEKIAALQGLPYYLPTLEIVPPLDVALLRNQVAHLDRYDWLIFVSPQAVTQSLAIIRPIWPIFPAAVKLAAIGEGTANLLSEAGFADILYPKEEWSSEGLLKLTPFHAVKGKHIALMQGEGGREMLAAELTARGAWVDSIVLYRRILPRKTANAEYLDLLHQQKIDIIIGTSGESLRNLIKLTGATHQSVLFTIPLVVVSQRLKQLAEELGFKKVFLAANASHNAIIETIRSLKGRNHGRE